MSDQNTEQMSPKDLREAYERKAQEAAEGAAAKRELAFLKAGVDTDTPQGKLLAKAYDGEPSPEAIKEFASEMGVDLAAPAAPAAESPEAPETPEVPKDEVAGRQALSGQAVPADVPQGNRLDAAYEERQHLIKAGRTREEASTPVIGAILSEAAAGNPDFIFNPKR